MSGNCAEAILKLLKESFQAGQPSSRLLQKASRYGGLTNTAQGKEFEELSLRFETTYGPSIDDFRDVLKF